MPVEIHSGNVQNVKGATSSVGLTKYKHMQDNPFQPAFLDCNNFYF